MGTTTWTPAENDKLRELWEAGMSSAEIGRQIGKTKNSVVSRAHRIGLSSRPSPIKRDASGLKAPLPRGGKTTTVVRRKPAPRKPLPKPTAPEIGDGVEGVGGKLGCCQWIVGEPAGTRTRYCGRPSSGPWCAAHRPVVMAPYVPPPPKAA